MRFSSKGVRVDKAKVLLIIVLVLSIASVSNALDILYVDVNGPNDPGIGTFDDPFRRIQDAIDDTSDGDIIEIRPGLYSGSGNYDLDPNGKSITIRSTEPNDPNIVANTIIDPNGSGRGFYFHSGEDANCIVSGLTIKNAYATDLGAGIYCDNSSPTIINCIITDNYAERYGGGVYCLDSNSLFKNCTISNNSALDGGGLGCQSGSPQLTNCIISNNRAISYAGGVDCYNQGNPVLTNCTLINNSVEPDGVGGAICLWDSDVNIKNSILWANKAKTGAQLYLHYGGSASISYCDVQGGEAEVVIDPDCTDCTLTWDANSNMNADPCFAQFDANGDPNLWDFHLQSAYGRWEPNSQSWVTDSNTSLCIDAGDPNSDWSDELWPNGRHINMGAFGGTNQASMNGNIADFNISGSVDFRDFAEFSDKWFAQEFCIEDLTNDGVVDFADLRMFVKNWLWQRE